MSDTQIQGEAFNLTKKHRSNGSELIPEDIQANTSHPEEDEGQSMEEHSIASYTVDDEGLLDSYAIAPEVSPVTSLPPQQQRKYIGMAASTILLLLLIVLFLLMSGVIS